MDHLFPYTALAVDKVNRRGLSNTAVVNASRRTQVLATVGLPGGTN